jgi:apolipoprotein N-acyltransferase
MNATSNSPLAIGAEVNTQSESLPPYNLRICAALIALGAVTFHMAFAHPVLSPLIVIYLGCLVEITRAKSGRLAFYSGLVFGLCVFVPKLGFFYTIFNFAAVPLWLILALWHALFVLLGRRARGQFKTSYVLVRIENIRARSRILEGEIYPLKFSWMAAGYAFARHPNILLSIAGVYGSSFILMLLAAVISRSHGKRRLLTSAVALAALALITQLPPSTKSETNRPVKLAGIQLEFPVELEVPGKLDSLLKQFPDADILVLSEYTFDGPLPPRIRKWCKENRKHLIVGAKDPAGADFYNTAFVIDPNGHVIFKQAKAVPIQFFKDGLPAPEQKIWRSPWGNLGIGVCYDLSYTRVVDALIRQGAQLLIFPTMDVAEWGKTQHELHALIGPTRAAEYGVPIFRLASSGISQAISAQGKTLASAEYPGQDAMLFSSMTPTISATLPLDRQVAPICVAAVIFFVFWSVIPRRKTVPR